MRHFTRHRTSSKHQHDDYWKLQSYSRMTAQQMRELLHVRHYAVGKSDGKDKLEEALLRSDCGMLSYADKSDDNLRALIKSRGVDASQVIYGSKVGSRGDLLSLLKDADMNPRFERFSDLPPELRNKPLYSPTEPPIARVNRAIRKDTIQMFYHSCTFNLVLKLPKTGNNFHGLRSLEADAQTLTIPSQMRLFMSSISAKHLACIRRLNIQVVPYHEKESAFQDAANMALSIEIAEQGLTFAIEPKQLSSILKHHGTTRGRGMFLTVLSDVAALRRQHLVRILVQKIVRNIVARDGKARLKLDDLYKHSLTSSSDESNVTLPQLRAKLRTGGYMVPASSTKAQVRELKGRMDRDLLDYARCSENELYKFASERNLITPNQKDAKGLSVQALRQILKAADDNRSFHMFLALPTAIRMTVYDHYMAEFPLVLEHPTQPPLTRTIKSIRNEAMPTFHKASKFKLTFTTLRAPYSGHQTLAFYPHHPSSHAYFNGLSEQSVGEIQNWILEWTTTPVYQCHIHFTGKKAQTQVWYEGGGNVDDNTKQAIVDAVKEVLDAVADAVPQRKLKHTDIMAMRRKWEAIAFSDDNGN
ncbi:uncharacterized protein MYCFIDRAFT_195117 [Pseudocercospora fijiensis CIRAD86]|uniref:Uncharacterized protein n=1 Tax=Pseudocercospora fijiensis (strain CIRAD86) TaxID=383855 RepID=M2ZY91_PSEFD|nr:uncharacterized protein MYCFIDRAFT_195117 [Pseudocercospora fijiensis CIRAD86]EME83919.1 hypothetical protein MYCFIDRAFT_195117 [Pseudocercospora fijiensis CIRAD86]